MDFSGFAPTWAIWDSQRCTELSHEKNQHHDQRKNTCSLSQWAFPLFSRHLFSRLPQISNGTKKPPPFARRKHRFRKGKAWLENAAQPRQPLGGNVPKRGDPRGIVCSVLGLTDWLHKVIHPAPGLRFPDAKEGASHKKINDGRALTLVRVTWRYNGRPATHYWAAYLCDSFIIHRSIQIKMFCNPQSLKCLWQW